MFLISLLWLNSKSDLVLFCRFTYIDKILSMPQGTLLAFFPELKLRKGFSRSFQSGNFDPISALQLCLKQTWWKLWLLYQGRIMLAAPFVPLVGLPFRGDNWNISRLGRKFNIGLFIQILHNIPMFSITFSYSGNLDPFLKMQESLRLNRILFLLIFWMQTICQWSGHLLFMS